LFAVVIVFKFLPPFLDLQDLPTYIAYPLTLGTILILTTGISHFSYRYYESYFLRKKLKYTTALSGDMAETKKIASSKTL
jgi:peptidoglycan/LPS O-acetylase OafA/YrhL